MQQGVEQDSENQKVMVETLFYHYAPSIFTFLRQQGFSREDAEDLLLEVFTAALEQKHLSNLSPSQQSALLWTIVRNKRVSAYRRKIRRPSVPMELVSGDLFADTQEEPEYEVVRLEEYVSLHSAIQILSPLQQKILQLRFVNELRSPQIALLVGKSETAVRTIISRTLNQLRKLYREKEK